MIAEGAGRDDQQVRSTSQQSGRGAAGSDLRLAEAVDLRHGIASSSRGPGERDRVRAVGLPVGPGPCDAGDVAALESQHVDLRAGEPGHGDPRRRRGELRRSVDRDDPTRVGHRDPVEVHQAVRRAVDSGHRDRHAVGALDEHAAGHRAGDHLLGDTAESHLAGDHTVHRHRDMVIVGDGEVDSASHCDGDRRPAWGQVVDGDDRGGRRPVGVHAPGEPWIVTGHARRVDLLLLDHCRVHRRRRCGDLGLRDRGTVDRHDEALRRVDHESVDVRARVERVDRVGPELHELAGRELRATAHPHRNRVARCVDDGQRLHLDTGPVHARGHQIVEADPVDAVGLDAECGGVADADHAAHLDPSRPADPGRRISGRLVLRRDAFGLGRLVARNDLCPSGLPVERDRCRHRADCFADLIRPVQGFGSHQVDVGQPQRRVLARHRLVVLERDERVAGADDDVGQCDLLALGVLSVDLVAGVGRLGARPPRDVDGVARLRRREVGHGHGSVERLIG